MNCTDQQPHLATEKQQHCQKKNLCFNCEYSDYLINEYSYLFNSNQIISNENQKLKTQSAQAHFRKHVKVQSLHVESSSDIHMTDKSESESE